MRKIIVMLLGLTLLALGISFIIQSNFGADPVTVMFTGVANLLNVTIGRASQIIMVCLIVIVYFVDKSKLGFATVSHAVLVGFLMDFFMTFSLPQGIISNVLGVTIMSAGLAMYITAELGAGALDCVTMILVNKSKLEFKYVRIGLDVVFVAIGLVLDATIGYGSMIAVVITGPLIQMFLKQFNTIKKLRTA
ncbi:hypothetical protein EZV73_20280 [Acidaminobacter sp. JC074]|uniref:YczE/YyaS/YitT family protein n=1 Tax=Acidaminobacter sp. JC074 TaxID=2530199 RepID=UPI001F110396|nr:YitT family protein [Acidaminobacter sp. JC074]MCH4889929.1 hypothetical protein [Acidaminobacter sp. JC074]